MEPVGLKRYMLIRAGLHVRPEEWFGLRLDDREDSVREMGETGEKASGSAPGEEDEGKRKSGLLYGLCHSLGSLRGIFRRRQEKRIAEERLQEENRRRKERENGIRRAEKEIAELCELIGELAGEDGVCRCVYESSVRKALLGEDDNDFLTPASAGGIREEKGSLGREAVLPSLWKKQFAWEEFQGYCDWFWAEKLMPRAVHAHYVVLGIAPCIYGLLEDNAHKMKSLYWILPEAECDQEFWDFAEDFYTEYGLAIELHTCGSRDEFRKLRLTRSCPVNVIDFAGDICFRTDGVAPGSVWLDMLSRDEKRYRISGRPGGIGYISLKEEWKHIQRLCKAPDLGRVMPDFSGGIGVSPTKDEGDNKHDTSD